MRGRRSCELWVVSGEKERREEKINHGEIRREGTDDK